MALSVARARAKNKHAVLVQVTVRGQPATLTGGWRDGFVEVTQNGTARIVDVVGLARDEPHLLRALIVMVQRICPEQMAHARIRQMSAAAQSEKLPCIKDLRYSKREEVRAHNTRRRAAWDMDLTRGMTVIDARVGDLQLGGVTPDGREWLVCGHRIPFTLLAQHCAELLPELLLAARPALMNFGGFMLAVCRTYPSVREHPHFCEQPVEGRGMQERKSSGHDWVADALAGSRTQPARSLPFARPLQNRTRYVR